MAIQGSSDNRFVKSSVIRGHHVYKAIWTPALPEKLFVKAEDGNVHDELAMAVVKDGNVDGHICPVRSHVSWFFLKHGGPILCCVTVKRKLGVGLEVACKYIYIYFLIPSMLFPHHCCNKMKECKAIAHIC